MLEPGLASAAGTVDQTTGSMKTPEIFGAILAVKTVGSPVCVLGIRCLFSPSSSGVDRIAILSTVTMRSLPGKKQTKPPSPVSFSPRWSGWMRRADRLSGGSRVAFDSYAAGRTPRFAIP